MIAGQYVVVDKIRYRMTRPTSIDDVRPFFDLLEKHEEFDDITSLPTFDFVTTEEVVQAIVSHAGWTAGQIGQLLGCSAKTVKKHVAKAKQQGLLPANFAFPRAKGAGRPSITKPKILQLFRQHPNWTYRQIAQVVGTSEGYVKQVLRRKKRN